MNLEYTLNIIVKTDREMINLITNTNNRNILQNVFSMEQLIKKIKLNLHKQKSLSKWEAFCCLVRAGRLELPHLTALDPKSSVSTNSTTPAKHAL